MLMRHSIAIQQTCLDEFRLQTEKCSTVSRSIGIQEGCVFSPLIPVIQNSISDHKKNSSQTAVPCGLILIYAIKSCLLLLLSCYLNPFKTVQDSLSIYPGSLAMLYLRLLLKKWVNLCPHYCLSCLSKQCISSAEEKQPSNS